MSKLDEYWEQMKRAEEIARGNDISEVVKITKDYLGRTVYHLSDGTQIYNMEVRQ